MHIKKRDQWLLRFFCNALYRYLAPLGRDDAEMP